MLLSYTLIGNVLFESEHLDQQTQEKLFLDAYHRSSWFVRWLLSFYLSVEEKEQLDIFDFVIDDLNQAHLLTSDNIDAIQRSADQLALINAVQLLARYKILTQIYFDLIKDRSTAARSIVEGLYYLERSNLLDDERRIKLAQHNSPELLTCGLRILYHENFLTKWSWDYLINMEPLNPFVMSYISEYQPKVIFMKQAVQRALEKSKKIILPFNDPDAGFPNDRLSFNQDLLNYICSFLDIDNYAQMMWLNKKYFHFVQRSPVIQERLQTRLMQLIAVEGENNQNKAMRVLQ